MIAQGPVYDRGPGERRRELLRALALATVSTTSADEACRRAADVLARYSRDFPFVLLFLADEAGRAARLTARAGLEPGAPAAPAQVSLDHDADPIDDAGWPLAKVHATGARIEVLDLERRFGPVHVGSSAEPIARAIVVSLHGSETAPLGFLVAGLAPHDAPAEDGVRAPGERIELIELIAIQLASALGHVRAFAAERLQVLTTAQRSAAETLRTSERRFRTVVRQAATGVVQADPSGRMTLVNQRWCEMLGYSEAELLTMNIADITADLAPTLAAVQRLAEGGPDFVIEKRYRRRDGSLLWASSSVSALRGPAGEYLGLVAVVVDISEQKRTQQLLLEQRNLLESIAAGRPLDGCLTAVTRAISRLGPSTRACILLADPERRSFASAYAADIPASFKLGLEDAPINALAIGACGEAVFRGQAVTCANITEDSRWSKTWRDLCVAHGILACHSEPVIGTDGRPLASLMLCFDTPREPSVWERSLAEFGTHVASIAIERDRAMQAVRDSEERLRLMVESVTDFAIFTTDSEGVVTTWNTGAEAVFGWHEADIVNHGTELLYTPEDRAAGVPAAERRLARETGRASNERWHLRKDGTRFFASGVVTPLHDHRRVGFTKVIRDVTLRKRTEDALAARVAELATLFDVVPIGLCVADDPDCQIIRLNPAMARLLRQPGDRTISLASPAEVRLIWRMYKGDRELGRPDLPIQRAARGETLHDNFCVVIERGPSLELEVFAAPLRDAHGRVAGAVAAFLDITERTRAEEVRLAAERALKASEERLRLMDRLGEATRAATDPAGIITATVRLLGEHLGATRCIYAEVDDHGGHFEIRHEWTATRASVTLGRYTLEQFGARPAADMRAGRTWVARDCPREVPAHEGADVFCAMNIRACMVRPVVKDGRLVAMIGVHQSTPREWTDDDVSVLEEVTERAWGHMERLQAIVALREADQRKDEFLATLAHELRNPLAPICTGLALLRIDPAGDAATKAREMMERQTGHMVRLIDDLLDVSRVSRGKVNLRKQRVTLRSVLESAVETSRPAITARRHALIVAITDEPLHLDADPTRISQVVSNLLHNAAKFTPEGGRIVLTAQRDGDEAVIRLTDTGLGIPPEMLPQVFDLFTQVGHGIDRAQGGLGIGLSLARQMVEMHGGSIAADSAGPGHGSTFTVRLPLAGAGPDEPVTAPEDTMTAPQPTHCRILVVDDNTDAAEGLAMLFESSGHDVRIAHDGPAALASAEVFAPEIVFLDIGLPGMSGYEVATAMRALPGLSAVILIALTGYGSDADKARSKTAGFDFHLTKPVQVATVEDVLARALHAMRG